MKKIFFAIIFISILLAKNKPVFAKHKIVCSVNVSMLERSGDERTIKLKKFLSYYNSPLEPFSQELVQMADKYNLDWRLIPSITGVESTFGKFIPQGSFNAYGWANGNYFFNSWEESIEIVAKTLKENYYEKGAETIEEIAKIYAPISNTWAKKVKLFMEAIENSPQNPSCYLELSL